MDKVWHAFGLVGVLTVSACQPAVRQSEVRPVDYSRPAAAPVPAPEAPPPATAAEEPGSPNAPTLRIAYSDWPGWVAWDIATQKGFFADANVNVDLMFFDYVPSLDAFAAHKVDAVCVAQVDALVTASSGAAGVAILLNDFSNGNDMIVARPGIAKVSDLKGLRVGVEVGFVAHLLLLEAMKSVGLSERSVTIVNVPTDQTPELLAGGKADAIGAWQPNSGAALGLVPGAKAIFTSADVPGLIYDVLFVEPRSLQQRRSDWLKVVKVWFRVVDFVDDPATHAEAVEIMSKRVMLTAEQYSKQVDGTKFLGADENRARFKRDPSLQSIYGSMSHAQAFDLKMNIYKRALEVDSLLDPSLVRDATATP